MLQINYRKRVSLLTDSFKKDGKGRDMDAHEPSLKSGWEHILISVVGCPCEGQCVQKCLI